MFMIHRKLPSVNLHWVPCTEIVPLGSSTFNELSEWPSLQETWD
jgi:hypothetical protein